MRRDWRSEEAASYRVLYRSKAWQVLREIVMRRDAYRCQRCGVFVKRGRSGERCAVVHHIRQHKGDEHLFFDPSNLQLVCKMCHDGPIQSEEVRGFRTDIGEDGWPTDPRHRGNR